MARVKRGVVAHARHKKVIKKAKGFRGRRKNTFKVAKQAVEKSMQYAYRDRKVRKRDFRSLWTQRINAGAREHGISYSVFIDGLKKLNIGPAIVPLIQATDFVATLDVPNFSSIILSVCL